MSKEPEPGKRIRALNLSLRVLLGLALASSGIAHLSFARVDYVSQVPTWVPLDASVIVAVSGVVEILLGIGVASRGKVVPWAGLAAALFFVAAVFPVRVGQYVEGIDAFWYDSDGTRLARLFIQPVWIVWALWSTSAISLLRRKPKTDDASQQRTDAMTNQVIRK